MAGAPLGQRERNLAVICILAIVIIGAYWYLVFKPRATDLGAVQQHVTQLMTVNQKAKSEMAKGDINELRRELAQYQQNLVLIRTLIPAGNEVPSLLEQVSTAARRVGLDVATVDPQPVIAGDNYDTYRYTISVVGGYHQLGEFLANVGDLTRIVLPVNVALQLSTNANANNLHKQANEAVLEARFQLQTFVTHTTVPDADLPPTMKGAKS